MHSHYILRGAILTHLPLTFESRDDQLEPDNGSQHLIDVVRWRVRNCPRRGPRRLMRFGQSSHMVTQLLWIVIEVDFAIRVNGKVIPSWYHFASLLLGRIPGRGDVCIRPKKYCERLNMRLRALPLWVRTRYMPM